MKKGIIIIIEKTHQDRTAGKTFQHLQAREEEGVNKNNNKEKRERVAYR